MYQTASASKPGPESFVVVPRVRAISNGLALICELSDGRRFGVPFDCIGKQSEVRHPGEHGAITVLRWFAEEHRLPITPE